MTAERAPALGATILRGGSGVTFRVWAPRAPTLELELVGPPSRRMAMRAGPHGVHEVTVPDAEAGADYWFVLPDGRRLPDPRSRHQPAGVHGPSRVVDPAAFRWTDAAWPGRPLAEYVIYELHVGTFTADGTFDAVIPKLRHLVDLGITAVELMPVAENPGDRNWGYDGVDLFAPQSTCGGPDGLRRLVDACHAHGLAVVLDVVYNHLGPEGNYLGQFGPYFTERYRTPWGEAINYDGAESDPVRAFVIDNAIAWMREYHVDALRLDAVHGIFDFSAWHVLAELRQRLDDVAADLGRPALLIAESDLNDVRVIAPSFEGGWGHDAQWCDDFHHAVRTVLTDDRRGYFADFGRLADVGKAIAEGFVYDGRYSAYRRRHHGNSSAQRPGQQFVVFLQNHDQIANASQGARLAALTDPARVRTSAALLACTPGVPLIFQGEEWGTATPFHYFVSHGDAELVAAVREGRRAEHEEFLAGHPGVTVPEYADPADPATMAACRLDWTEIEADGHRQVLELYRALFALRRTSSSLGNCRRDLTDVRVDEAARTLRLVRRDSAGATAHCLFNLSAEARELAVPAEPGEYVRLLATEEVHFGGSGELPPERLEVPGDRAARIACAPWSAVIYGRSTRG